MNIWDVLRGSVVSGINDTDPPDFELQRLLRSPEFLQQQTSKAIPNEDFRKKMWMQHQLRSNPDEMNSLLNMYQQGDQQRQQELLQKYRGHLGKRFM